MSSGLGYRMRHAVLLLAGLVSLWVLPVTVEAIPGLNPNSGEFGLQNLVMGTSSLQDVTRALGEPPDELLSGEQMFPVITNALYYDKAGSGNATLFVFENNLLVGMHLRGAQGQLMDLSFLLPNNGNRALVGIPGLMGYMPYYMNANAYSSLSDFSPNEGNFFNEP